MSGVVGALMCAVLEHVSVGWEIRVIDEGEGICLLASVWASAGDGVVLCVRQRWDGIVRVQGRR